MNTIDVYVLLRSETIPREKIVSTIPQPPQRVYEPGERHHPLAPPRQHRTWSYQPLQTVDEQPSKYTLNEVVRDTLLPICSSLEELVSLYPADDLDVLVWCDLFIETSYYPEMELSAEVLALLARCRARLAINLYGTTCD